MAVDTARFVARVIANQIGATLTPDFGAPDSQDVATDWFRDIVFTNGVAAGMGDRLYQKRHTIAASGTLDLDLNGGGLLDVFGAAFSIVKIRALLITAADANTNNVVVGAAAATPLSSILGTTHTLQIKPGGAFQVIDGVGDLAGYAVAAGANDVLRLANGGAGTPVTCEVVVLGTST